jgi:putative CocE/NonD family hydrolase
MFASGDRPPTDYERAPEHDGIIRELDVVVPMRDGTRLVLDVYRPEAPGRFPALFAFGGHPKHIQGPDVSAAMTPQPSWSTLWTGHMEAGDTQFFVSRGYVHVIGSPRGIGKSDGGGSREWDAYDVIEWIAAQPWCDGQVGMVGIGAFAGEQYAAARKQPPHLKVIFPYDGRGAYGPYGGFRHEYPGGVIHTMRYLVDHFSAAHTQKGQPGDLPPEKEALWREAMANADYKMYPHIYNVVAQKRQHMPAYFDLLLDPYDDEKAVEQAEADFAKITVPTYAGSGWYAYTYKYHLNGAQSYFANISSPKKLTLSGPSHLERPWRSFRNETLRWYDHWLKGIDSGMLHEPPVKYWVAGANEWRTAQDWPLPETVWTKLYLNSWERLTTEPGTPASYDEVQPPDTFVQMPPTQTNRIARLRYMTDPLSSDVLVAGPITLNLFAAIDQDDTNWIIILRDVGPDVSVRTVRDGERDISETLPERELTRGWLKASLRALDPVRSKPWKPWHRLTRASRQPVEPSKIEHYAIELLSTANLFRRGHRICLEITSMDMPTGVAGATNAEYVPYHICDSRTTVHRIYRDVAHPSHLLLPIIPQDDAR